MTMSKQTPYGFLQAHDYKDSIDPTGYWLSEKLDGVRALWDGKQFVSREGNVFAHLPGFELGLPDYKLDGELFLGRNQFEETISIVKRKEPDSRWNQIRYAIFDVPSLDHKPIEARFKHLHCTIGFYTDLKHYVLPQVKCKDKIHLDQFHETILALGGEGTILRQPYSKYEHKRSMCCLKLKTLHDAEATIVGYKPGLGKHDGVLGAYAMLMPNGETFDLGTGFTDAERANPLPIGTVVTYTYTNLTIHGKPRHPKFKRLHHGV